MPPKKAYCFTLNNYSDEEYRSICGIAETESQYAIIGREVGESGTPHLQGYIIFKRPHRFETIKNRLLVRCHIEVAAGSTDANVRYCSKDGDLREFGVRPKDSTRGKRLEVARRFAETMESGRSGMAKFIDEFPDQWYFSGHNLLRNFLISRPTIDRPGVNVRWFYGPPGVGKSRRAHEELKEAYIKDPKTKWWNGYLCESDIIIDDYGPMCVDINHLLRWFDRYKCLVESKGGMLPLYGVNFIVTSNFHPNDLFRVNSFKFDVNISNSVEEAHPQLPALMRRIKLVQF